MGCMWGLLDPHPVWVRFLLHDPSVPMIRGHSILLVILLLFLLQFFLFL